MKRIIFVISMIFVLSMPVYVCCADDNSEIVQEESDQPSIPICIIGGAVISLVGCFIRLQSNKTVAEAHNATRYIKGESNIKVSEDIFLYRTETRTERAKNK